MMGREPLLPWPDTLRWCIAGALVLGLHGLAFVAIMRAPEGNPESAAETAIMIDLEPVAVMNTAPVERVDTPEQAEPLEPEEPPPTIEPEMVEPLETIEPVETAELAEPIEQPEAIEPLEPVEPEPMVEEEEPPPEEIEPIEPEPVEAESDVALAPTPRPRAERPPSVERPRPTRQAQQQPRRQQQPPPQRERPAQQAASAGRQVSQDEVQRWRQQVQARFARLGARAGGLTGTVRVRLAINASGQITNASVATSSGNPELDNIAVSTASRVGSVPPPPEGASNVTIPIQFGR